MSGFTDTHRARMATIRDANNDARLDDLRWLVETHETLTGAATRLGISADALDKWCRNRGHTDLLARLLAHEPRDWNRSTA